MFFSLTSAQDTRFMTAYQLTPSKWLNLDSGWSYFTCGSKTVILKGYSEQFSKIEDLAHALADNSVPTYRGNFLGFVVDESIIKITHDLDRSSPIYVNQETGDVSNLFKLDQFITVHTTVTVVNDSVKLSHYTLHPCTASPDSVLQEIDNIISAKFRWLKEQGKTVKIFFSGGLDTLTCIAYLKRFDVPFELLNKDISFAEAGVLWNPDKFIQEFRTDLRKNWGYKQFHHWQEPTWTVTGACGDEVFMRNPDNAAIYLSSIGKNLYDIVTEDHYHYRYFLKKKKQLQDLPIIPKSLAKLDVLRRVINDHQHWHLGNTTTFTPLHDTRIIQLVLQLPEQQLIDTIVDGYIQKELVKLSDPSLLQYLAVQKNTNQYVEEAISKLMLAS